MKTTIDIHDSLLERARHLARETGRPLRAVVEDGLRRVLDETDRATPYRMPDRSVGSPDDPNPLEAMSWQDVRSEIYGGDGSA